MYNIHSPAEAANAAAGTQALRTLVTHTLRSRILLQRLLRPVHASLPAHPLADAVRVAAGDGSGSGGGGGGGSGGGSLDAGLAAVSEGVAGYVAGALRVWDAVEPEDGGGKRQRVKGAWEGLYLFFYLTSVAFLF
jgi:hypothetical protein